MYIKTCTHCSKTYHTEKYRTKYCSTMCKKEKYTFFLNTPEGKERSLLAKKKWRDTKGQSVEYKAHLAKIARDKRKENPEKFREKVWRSRLKTQYNLTEEEYINILHKQKSCCAICKKKIATLKGKRGGLNIDHCHKTGKVRGLLCTTCNTALGKFKDNTEYLQNAINYLLETRDYL